MSLVSDLYIPRRSWLHRLDPRVKLWGTVLGFVTAFLLPNLVAQLAYLTALHVLLLSARIPWRAIAGLWRQMALLIVLILVLQTLFVPSGDVLFSLGPLRLTLGGLANAATLATRALGLAFVTGALLLTTDQQALVRAFVRLGMPYLAGLTLSLTLRFLPTIQHLFSSVREAQAARGWVAEGGPLRRLRGYIPVLVAAVIGTLRTSDQLTLALAARGLTATTPRTTWHDLAMRSIDWVVLIVVTLAFGGLWMVL